MKYKHNNTLHEWNKINQKLCAKVINKYDESFKDKVKLDEVIQSNLILDKIKKNNYEKPIQTKIVKTQITPKTATVTPRNILKDNIDSQKNENEDNEDNVSNFK